MVDDEIFLFGGKNEREVYDDILVYDLIKNECRKVSKLPYPVHYMSTVQVKDKVNILTLMSLLFFNTFLSVIASI